MTVLAVTMSFSWIFYEIHFSGVKFDVIVTDPPYGIREQMTKVGTYKDYSKSSIPEEYLKTHVPEKVSYSLEHILEVIYVIYNLPFLWTMYVRSL